MKKLILTLSAILVSFMICGCIHRSTVSPQSPPPPVPQSSPSIIAPTPVAIPTPIDQVERLQQAAIMLREQKRPLSDAAEYALVELSVSDDKIFLQIEYPVLQDMADQLMDIASHPSNNQDDDNQNNIEATFIKQEAIKQDIDNNIVMMYEYIITAAIRKIPYYDSHPTITTAAISNSSLWIVGSSKIPVTVKTLSNGKEEPGWRIFFMEYFFRSIRNNVGPDSFPGLSSPSLYELAPGRFIIEARTADGKRGGCVVATIMRPTVLELAVSSTDAASCY